MIRCGDGLNSRLQLARNQYLKMLKILKDAVRRPDLFYWFGAIERSQLESWVRSSGLLVPSDLFEFWSQTGGGDLFESDTIFRPTSIPSSMPFFVSGDDLIAANEQRKKDGMPKSYLAFHDGAFLSAVRRSDRALVTLNERYEEIAEYSSLDEWYLRALRADLAARYGLHTSAD